MCRPIIAILLLAALLGTPALSRAHSRPYVLRQQPIMAKDPYGPGMDVDHVVLRLYRRHGRKPIWVGAVNDVNNLTWSRDGRAFVAWGQPYPVHGKPFDGRSFGLFVWREGDRWKQVHFRSFDPWDYFWDFHWSPDARFVAFRAGGSGDIDVNDGHLYLYDAARNRLLPVPKEDIGKMRWVGRRTLRYWPRVLRVRRKGNEFDGHFYNKKPRLWHVRG